MRAERTCIGEYAHVTKLSTFICQIVKTSSARFWKRQGADSDSADMLDAALGGGGGGGRGGDPSHWPAASHLPRPQQPHAPSMEEEAARHFTTARCHLTAAARCNATPRNTTPRSRRSHAAALRPQRMPSAIPSVDGWTPICCCCCHYVPQAVMRRCWRLLWYQCCCCGDEAAAVKAAAKAVKAA